MTSLRTPSGGTGTAAAGDARVLAGLEGRIEPVVPSFGYRLSLLVISGLLVLLPILYLALIGAVISGMWAYVTYLPFDPTAHRGRQLAGAFIYWLVPLVIGGLLVLFLIKPIFARPPRAVKPLALDRRRQPLLFAFVEKLCQVLGAPIPAAIHLDNHANASVRLRSGRRREPILILGTSLVAGLSLAQLAGVLAHEFGHFKQHAGLRLSSFVRRFNRWLARLTYGRDAFDDWLVRQSKDTDNGFLSIFVLYPSRGAVWLVRKLLAGLVWLAQAISSYQTRHMELDADRYQARLVGYPVFAATIGEVQLLDLAHHQALASLEECWSDGRLPDSLAQLTLVNRRSLDPELVEVMRKATAEGKTGLFDSHPAPADRLAAARQEQGAPAFASEQAATVLFDDFPALCRLVTRAHYCTVLGEAVRTEQLMTVERTVTQLEQSSHEREALGAYFGSGISSLRPLALGAISAGTPVTEIDVARRLALASAAELEAELETYSETYGLLVGTRQAEALLDIRLPVDADELGLPGKDMPTVLRVQEEAVARLESLEASLGPREQQQGRRLGGALGLLALPEVAEAVDSDGSLRAEVPVLVELTVLLGSLFPAGRELTADRAVFAILASKLEDYKDYKELHRGLGVAMGRILKRLEFFGDALSGVAYPFEHAAIPSAPLRGDTEALTLGQYVVAVPDEPENAGELYAASGHTQERFYEVYFRAAGRLAAIAQRLEQAVGLEPEPAGDATRPEA